MEYKNYLGKYVLDNVEDIIVPDVDVIDDDGVMVNIYFPLEQFEDEPGKLLRTGLLVSYDINRVVTHIMTTAMVLEQGKKPVEMDPVMCEDEELITAVLERILE